MRKYVNEKWVFEVREFGEGLLCLCWIWIELKVKVGGWGEEKPWP